MLALLLTIEKFVEIISRCFNKFDIGSDGALMLLLIPVSTQLTQLIECIAILFKEIDLYLCHRFTQDKSQETSHLSHSSWLISCFWHYRSFYSSWMSFILACHFFYCSLWIKSYLLNRSFYVNIENSNSSVFQLRTIGRDFVTRKLYTFKCI